MLTIIHILFDLCLYFLFGKIISVNYADLALLLCVNLIDLDHLLSRPVYKKGRNSFKTHILHKQWKLFLVVAALLLFFRPLMFIGIGLISHFLLDYIDSCINSAKII